MQHKYAFQSAAAEAEWKETALLSSRANCKLYDSSTGELNYTTSKKIPPKVIAQQSTWATQMSIISC